MVLEGAPRAIAAQICGMDRQTLCYWVHRYNDEGVPGLDADPRELVIAGPDPERDSVGRWRCIELQQRSGHQETCVSRRAGELAFSPARPSSALGQALNGLQRDSVVAGRGDSGHMLPSRQVKSPAPCDV
jgi:hypothetical protein